MKMRSIRTLLFALVVLSMSAAAFAQIGVNISFGPPALPIYEQPLCPGDGYIWTPGYWGWGDDFNDYYWVPGTWIEAPEVGFLWTPPYWGWGGSGYIFNAGYWGPQIGFYGGINYGFGYFGNGFEGGRWNGGHFFYNRSVTNINVTNIHNVYNETVVNRNETRVSFNGGNGGINVRPTPQQEAAAHERHIGPVANQLKQRELARGDEQQRASKNEGRPPVAATMKPADFKGEGVVKAREAGAPYQRPANAGNAKQNNMGQNNMGEKNMGQNKMGQQKPSHVKDMPAPEKMAAPNTGNPKMDKKYQQQEDKQYQKQTQERQKMQQQQEKEDQRAQQQQNQQRQQQVEQRHQQQTEQLQQRQQQRQQQMQQRMPQPRPQPQQQPQHEEQRPH